jgi:Leucine-rich repeat (LRR) protein
MKQLILSGNQIGYETIDLVIQNFRGLEKLGLDNLRLTKLPVEVGILKASGCDVSIKGNPMGIELIGDGKSLKKADKLNYAGLHLHDLPDCITRLTLSHLDLSRNPLQINETMKNTIKVRMRGCVIYWPH